MMYKSFIRPHSGYADITYDPLNNDSFNPIQDWGGGKKAPPASFSPVTSTTVGINPQNFLTFSFNPFDRLV